MQSQRYRHLRKAAGRIRYDRGGIIILFCIIWYTLVCSFSPIVSRSDSSEASDVLDIRYKLSISVLAAGKIYFNSSVVGLTYKKASYFRIVSSPLIHYMNGPCPSIDLGPNGILFVVDSMPHLAGPKRGAEAGKFLYPDATSLVFLPFEVYPIKPKGDEYPLRLLDHKSVSGMFAGAVDVPLDRLPMIVRFRNIADPNSIEELDPNDLSPAYGKGSRVIKATLEITRDDRPVSVPTYWPAWIAEAETPLSLRIAVPVAGTKAAVHEVHFLDIYQFKGIPRINPAP